MGERVNSRAFTPYQWSSERKASAYTDVENSNVLFPRDTTLIHVKASLATFNYITPEADDDMGGEEQ